MDLVFRTVFVFFLIFVVTRAVGRRELSSMEPFDMILLVVMGDLIQQGVTQSDYSLTGATIVLSTLALLVVGTAYASFRVPRLRPVLEGEPVVLVSGGEVVERALRRERITDSKVSLLPNESRGFALAVELHLNLPQLDGEQAVQLVRTAHGVCPYS